jgi:hypothetical protein
VFRSQFSAVVISISLLIAVRYEARKEHENIADSEEKRDF